MCTCQVIGFMLKHRSYPRAALMLCKSFSSIMWNTWSTFSAGLLADNLWLHVVPIATAYLLSVKWLYLSKVKWLKGNLCNAWFWIQNLGLFRMEDWQKIVCACCVYIVHHKNKSGSTTYCALHVSFNTAFTLLLSFTFVNLVFRSFDHEKRSWQEQLFSKNLKKNYWSAVSSS